MDTKFGIPPNVFLYSSIVWSLHTFFTTHYKAIITEKGFLSFPAKVSVFFWAVFASFRRISGIVAFFIPSMGLFNFLYHWKYEQKPFR